MKQKLLAFILSFLFIGSINAQESHWSMNSYDYPDARPFIGKVMINGVLQSTTNIEIAAFVGEQVRAVGRLVEIAPDKLPGEFFVWFNIKYHNAGEAVAFKIYDHVSESEFDNYTATVSGSPVTIVTGMDNPGSPRVPVMINFVTTQTFEKPITAYTSDKDRYYLIASPIGTVSPENVTNMLSNSYDLYRFNQSAPANDQGITLEWENYKQVGDNYHFNLEPGKGYLYANSGNGADDQITLTFRGTPYNGDGQVDLIYDNAESVSLKGWNLIGNPFGAEATLNKPYYRLNTEGNALKTETEETSIAVMEGVFVQATETGEKANFAAVRRNERADVAKLNISVVASTSSSTALDNAIVRFDGGATLGKFQLNPSHTKVYIPQDGKDYAIVSSAAQGEMAVNFKAEKNGTYTLSFSNEEVTFSYLHLIDNLTGKDVDLLQQPNYSFEARTTDYASRFRLVYSANNTDENGASTGSATFAYYNGSNWTVSATGSGAATLQVIDMMGRVLSSETISGNTEININQPAGVYMLRLIDNENVRVQKVVVR